MNQIEQIGINIDEGLDTADTKQIEQAVQEIDGLLEEADNTDQPILLYYRANAFAALRTLNLDFRKNPFSWQLPEFSEEILSLRKAIKCPSFEKLNEIRRCQILTNLGNALNTVGRPIEAIAAWDKALAIEPKFAMASTNRAYGLANYSAAFYDPRHQCLFLDSAVKDFRNALSQDAEWESDYPDTVREDIQTKLRECENYLSAQCQLDGFDPYAFELGDNDDARHLNKWRLDNRLFLNPLNDLGSWPVAAQDIFHLPNHTYGIDEEPRFVRYFDLIKQEYVAACVMLHEGIDCDWVHSADHTLLTFEHSDYSITSVQIEKQKAAFRSAYSLLDKCAVFINDYFKLGQNPRSLSASFRKVWFSDPNKKLLNPKLPMQNWRLRGLYSISLDLFDIDFKEVASPIAVKANEVRNAAEHRFISVHEFTKPSNNPKLCECVTAEELIELTLHMLNLARATIMGLSLAVYHQENHLEKQSENHLVIPMDLLPKNRP